MIRSGVDRRKAEGGRRKAEGAQIALLLLLAAALPAVDGAGVLASMRERAGAEFGPDLIAEAVDRTPALAAIPAGAPPAAARQAAAWALGCWWSIAPGRGVVFSRSPRLPAGPRRVRALPSRFEHRDDLARLVDRWMAPWCSDDGGIAYFPVDGSWTASLDAAGQERLLELLTLLESGRPQAPPAIGEAGVDATAAVPALPAAWDVWLAALATALGRPVAAAPALRERRPPALPAGTWSAACPALLAAGLRWRLIAGVLCLGSAAVDDAEHPAQRRRLALIPVPHLAGDDRAGAELAGRLVREVAPAAWTLPGWGLTWRREHRALLIAADPAAIGAVLDRLGRLDREE